MFKDAIRSYRKQGLKYFTPARAWLFLRSKFRILTGFKIKETEAVEFSEMITYKALTCPDCVQLGHCRVCGCPINELFIATEVGCPDDRFPAFEKKGDWDFIKYHLKNKDFKGAWEEFRDKEHWIEGWRRFKLENNIKFNIFK